MSELDKTIDRLLLAEPGKLTQGLAAAIKEVLADLLAKAREKAVSLDGNADAYQEGENSEAYAVLLSDLEAIVKEICGE